MWINFFIDIALLAVLVIGVLVGAHRGFVRTIAKPVRLTLSLVSSICFYRFVCESWIEPLVATPISTQLAEILKDKYSEITASTSNELPTLVKLAASVADIDLEAIASEDGEYVNALISRITDPAVGIISVVVSFIAVFIISFLVATVVLFALDKLISNGIGGFVNKLAGGALAFVFAFTVVWCFVGALEFVFAFPNIAETDIARNFTGGQVYRFFKSFSPFDLLLSF